MIFATCGSSHLGFPRLMTALAVVAPERLVVQHGPADPPPAAQAIPFLAFEQMVAHIERAEVVICHAGVGSIICAIRAGHVPIVFPRLRRHHETVDDHQAELASTLAQRGTVRVASSPKELAEALADLPARGAAVVTDAAQLGAAVRAAVHGEPFLVAAS